jgi:hypothetical protein
VRGSLKRRVLAITLLAGVAVGLIFLAKTRAEHLALNQESRNFADQAVIAVASNWNKQALLDRGSEELLEASQFQVDIDDQFAQWGRLGPMLNYRGVAGEARQDFSLQTGKIVTAIYSASARFERGSAVIRIGLVKRLGQWQIASFQVTPTFDHPLFKLPDARTRRS